MKVKFGPYELDSEVPELLRNSATVPVEPKVFDVLAYLIRHRDRVVSKDELIENVWQGRIVSDAAITSRINLVRSAVGDSGRAQTIIQTIPKRGFRFVATVEETSNAAEGSPTTITPSDPRLDHRLLVLVMPFRDLTKDASGFLSQGLTEDLTVALSRYSDVSVVSAQSARKLSETSSLLETPLASVPAEFLVTGTIRVHESNVRVTVQLLERNTGVTVFSEKYDRQINDIFALQDEIVQSLAGCLPWRAIDAVGRKLATERPPRLTSYEKYLQVSADFDHQVDIPKYLSALQSILAEDPGYAFVHAQLAFMLIYKVFHTGQQTEQEIRTATEHARKALKLAPHNERVLAKTAMVFQFIGQFSVAMQLSSQAMQLNPNSTDCTHFHATVLGASGRAEEALELHKLTQALDPLFPEYHYEGMVETLFLMGRYGEALRIIDKWRNPGRHILAYTAAFAAMAGEDLRAKENVEAFEKTSPQGFSNATFVGSILRYHSQETDRDKWLNAFVKAKLSGLESLVQLRVSR